MFSIGFKWTGPKTTSTARLRGKFMNAAKWTAKYMLKLLVEYVSVFEHLDVEFEDKFIYKGGDINAVVQLKGGIFGGDTATNPITGQPRDKTWNEIFVFLNEGTSVRHAVLDDGYVHKTAPHSRFSQPGNDVVKAINPYYDGPGLEARDVFELIGLEGQKEIEKRVEQILYDLQRGII